MSKSKPSRDAQAVEKVAAHWDWLDKQIVIKLLASQRRGIVRMISRKRAGLANTTISGRDAKIYQDGAVQACDDLLRALRGKR